MTEPNSFKKKVIILINETKKQDKYLHYALKILVKKDETGNYVPTDVATNYKQKFVLKYNFILKTKLLVL